MHKTLLALVAVAAFVQAQNGACDRACLEGFVNQYLAALEARDPTKLPLTTNAKYTENGVQLKLGDGMWGPTIKMTGYKLYFADPKAGQAGFYGSLEEHGQSRDSRPLAPPERRTRDELIAASDAYFEGTEKGTDKVMPFDPTASASKTAS